MNPVLEIWKQKQSELSIAAREGPWAEPQYPDRWGGGSSQEPMEK